MSDESNRRGFLKFLLGMPFGFSAVKNLYGQSEQKKELLLNVFSIAGYQFYDGESVEERLKVGEALMLRAEPDNPYDPFAVEILTADGMKLGYVPKSDNKAISRLLRQKADVVAKVEQVIPENVSWQRVRVRVGLVI